MSNAPRVGRAGAAASVFDRSERIQPWTAALLSAVLHVVAVLLALSARPETLSTPQGSMAGGQVIEVTFIDDAPDPSAAIPSPAPPVPMPPRPRPSRAAEPEPAPLPSASAPSSALQVQATPVEEPAPTDPVEPAAEPTPRALRSTGRPDHVWGQPPGMPPPRRAAASAGPAPNPVRDRGRRNDPPSAQPSMEVGGYQVLYELVGDARLREWQDSGMTEIYIPLPGTRNYMVCPLETALRRGSGPCRLLAPEDPAMADIGDAREVLTLHRVYRRGELMWRGPGAYR